MKFTLLYDNIFLASQYFVPKHLASFVFIHHDIESQFHVILILKRNLYFRAKSLHTIYN